MLHLDKLTSTELSYGNRPIIVTLYKQFNFVPDLITFGFHLNTLPNFVHPFSQVKITIITMLSSHCLIRMASEVSSVRVYVL